MLSYILEKENVHDYAIEKTDKGKPYIKNSSVKFNVSHTNGMILIVTGSGEIGCDVERMKEFSMKTAKRISTENEYEKILKSIDQKRTFFSLWTFKEAFVKFLGTGLSYSLKKATLDEDMSITMVYPELKIFTMVDGDYVLTAIENHGEDINIIKLTTEQINNS